MPNPRSRQGPAGPEPSGRSGLAPLVSVRRTALWRRRATTSLAPGTVQVLLDCAETLSEGEIRGSDRDATYLGTTMVTIDLRKASRRLRIDPVGAATDLAERLGRCAELRLCALRIARLEAERRLGGRLPGAMRAEIGTRAGEGVVLVDVDVELPLADTSEGRGRGPGRADRSSGDRR